jgi:hypothetical protein
VNRHGGALRQRWRHLRREPPTARMPKSDARDYATHDRGGREYREGVHTANCRREPSGRGDRRRCDGAMTTASNCTGAAMPSAKLVVAEVFRCSAAALERPAGARATLPTSRTAAVRNSLSLSRTRYWWWRRRVSGQGGGRRTLRAPKGVLSPGRGGLQPIPGVNGLRAELGEFVTDARKAGKIYRAAHA